MIPLSDPIWTRLYGPYGVRRQRDQLAELVEQWDARAARDLFWEDLHHQSSLYPVTYAALPWIWEKFPRDDPEVKSFLSQVVGYALDPWLREGLKYNGLSLDVTDHHWRPQEEWLTDDDMVLLAQQQEWLDSHIVDLAQAGLVGVADTDRITAPYLLDGYLSLNDAWTVRDATYMWACEPAEIREEVELDSPEAQAKFRQDIELVAPLHPELYEWLRTIVPDP